MFLLRRHRRYHDDCDIVTKKTRKMHEDQKTFLLEGEVHSNALQTLEDEVASQKKRLNDYL